MEKLKKDIIASSMGMVFIFFVIAVVLLFYDVATTAVKVKVADRWTRTDHVNYDARLSKKLEDIDNRIRALESR